MKHAHRLQSFYCYDNLNRMTGVSTTDPTCDTGKLATYVYDPLSRRQSVTYGNNASMAYTYFPSGDLQTLNHNMAGTGDDPQYTFTYTAAHELYSEANSDSDYMWQPSATASTTYTAANSLNQYPSVGGTTFTYDPKGNLASDGTWAFAYDAENRLLTACKPLVSGVCSSSPTVNATYAYDPLGRRNHKSGTGVTETYFLDDGDDELADYNASGTLTQHYVPGPGIDEPIVDVNGAASVFWYFHTNHQGSVIAMSGAGAARVAGPFTYDPYGNCYSAGAPCTAGEPPFRFTGQRYDPETGCYYYRARYYCADDLRGGRFLQTDPVGYTADLNLYTYVGNDPLNRVDPTGEFCIGSFPNAVFCARSDRYSALDQKLGDRTNFFGAASNVTAAMASMIAFAGLSNAEVNFMGTLSANLETLNTERAQQIGSGRLYASGSTEQHDIDFVKFEQRNVQNALDQLRKANPGLYAKLITDINNGMNNVTTNKLDTPFDYSFQAAVIATQNGLGRPIDFGNLSDRVQLGTNEAKIAGSVKATGTLPDYTQGGCPPLQSGLGCSNGAFWQ